MITYVWLSKWTVRMNDEEYSGTDACEGVDVDG